MSYRIDVDNADLDLFCLLEEPASCKPGLMKAVTSLEDVDVIVCQGEFAWTGELHTVYYRHDLDFSVDLCIIGSESARRFFWEPNGHILFDRKGTIDQSRQAQQADPEFKRHPFLKDNPLELAVVTLKKIRKNLARNHLWNALEQLAVLRRYIMQVVRLEVIGNYEFLGRVDRDIEDVLPAEINVAFAHTVARYEASDIAVKAMELSDMLRSYAWRPTARRERGVADWLLRQLEHERNLLMRCSK